MFISYREPDLIYCACGEPALLYGKRCEKHVFSQDGTVQIYGCYKLPECLFIGCEEEIKFWEYLDESKTLRWEGSDHTMGCFCKKHCEKSDKYGNSNIEASLRLFHETESNKDI